jgi:hypothetical protein
MSFKNYIEYKENPPTHNVTHFKHGVIGTFQHDKGFKSTHPKYSSGKKIPKGSQVESKPLSFTIKNLKLTKIK